jgi:hypothetical protein
MLYRTKLLAKFVIPAKAGIHRGLDPLSQPEMKKRP